MSNKDVYKLKVEAESEMVTTRFKGFNLVAKDLENMVVGQTCFIYKIYEGKSKAEEYRESLIGALGDEVGNYKVTLTDEDGNYRLDVRRIK